MSGNVCKKVIATGIWNSRLMRGAQGVVSTADRRRAVTDVVVERAAWAGLAHYCPPKGQREGPLDSQTVQSFSLGAPISGIHLIPGGEFLMLIQSVCLWEERY
jgi:hypothetical protein